MRVAVTGGSGLVGGKLVDALLGRGDEVWIITRAKDSIKQRQDRLHVVTWDELERQPLQLQGVEAIVNLAGESINQRWTDKAKERILQSRLKAAAGIARLAQALSRQPAVVVNASGISYYGTSETATFDETSEQRITDFLSHVVDQWERAAEAIPTDRLVKLRISLVLDAKGGAFPLMALPYRLFGGGRVGSGRQWVSWIHMEDMVRLILFCIDNEAVAGPVNASSPQPVTNDQFGRAVGRAMGRPHWFPVPATLMKTLFGELSVLLLEGQRALPRRAEELGFEFRYPTVDAAMQDLLKK
ncbi:TIGR01777 family protein [Paenibacillus sp. 598K]|uniref:TIGR01777 family oxidoreductase n=1 Tax=Paenibacillus sp. 598K TaxID=1117987 RepID=UPI000FF930C5|nr:TIGR01777 family oxidoreductase [Paenibacillus sp. 598K]GBF76440.1 TIGR01777 family protein [Paenibacillus sp. 598K]